MPLDLLPTTLDRGVDRANHLLSELLGQPERWQADLVDLAVGRAYTKVLDRDDADAWLILWAPGSALELHDHGWSSASIAVVRGRLVERHRTRTDPTLHRRTLRRGDSVSFGPEHLHAVENRHRHTAASLHVYSPPLAEMTFPGTAGQVVTPRAPGWNRSPAGTVAP